jgi:surface protein
MPELIHTFTSGKMNKDLDERILPNGEYRDALNLEVASSDTSQVGVFQNLKGNTEKSYSSYNPTTKQHTVWDPAVYIGALTNAVCIGSIAEPNSDMIYWFITSDEADIIASYNTVTKVTLPLIVDFNSVFNFDADHLITGVNIIEGILLWTDNQTEPKQIYISEWVGSTPDFFTHSRIYNRDFIESDTTVIKKYPLQPPTITAYSTAEVDEQGNSANVETSTLYSFYEQVPGTTDPTQIGPMTPSSGPQTLTWLGQALPFYRVGQKLLLTNSNADPLDPGATIRVNIESIIGASGNQTGAVVTVLSVGSSDDGGSLQLTSYNVILEQQPPFFEFRFARFGYRYKYKNNEVSAYSPFTNPAFLPGPFSYSPKEGYNLGMVNNIRQLKISGFKPADIPEGVASVDILYKASDNSNVYVVDTFKETDEEWTSNSFNISSEIISSVVQSNQLLRPYDNVPRFALGQEVIANRLIYANYTQNFNMLTSTLDPLQVNLNVTTVSKEILTTDGLGVTQGVGLDGNRVYPSLKSIRTYQVGVAYQDEYGRTTPVFTGKDASVVIEKGEAQFANSIKAQLVNNAPYYDQNKTFSTFKYYVKETSQEYYNLCLDRFYDAEDGNIWLSFPSAERNKIDEETFLILKKEHDNDKPVTEKAKYKVIAIENEAPQYLKETRLSKGQSTGWDFIGGFPIEGASEIWFDSVEKFDQDFGEITRSQSGLQVRVLTSGSTSEWYKISSFGIVGNGSTPSTQQVRITCSKSFGADMNFTSTEPYGFNTRVPGLTLELAEIQTLNKPEFTGRFFVKVNQDALLQSKIINAGANNTDTYLRKALAYTYYLTGSREGNSFWGKGAMNGNNWTKDDAQGNSERFYISAVATRCSRGNYTGASSVALGGTGTPGKLRVAWSGGYGAGRNDGLRISNPALLAQLNTAGALFRFIDAGNGKTDPNGTIYRITKTKEQKLTNYDCRSGGAYINTTNQTTWWILDIEPIQGDLFGLQWDPTKQTDGSGIDEWTVASSARGDNFIGMEFLGLDTDDTSFTSSNPAVFETEPKEATELDIYYEVSGNYPIEDHGDSHELDWFNCYSFGNGVESDRIRDDYNAPTMSNGVKASATLDEPYEQETRSNGLIFSQIFNSTSGVNGLNQFIQAESITKDVNPEYGSIQKLHARDTDLITLCENKSMKILANKDALFNADGSANVTSNRAVLGQTITYQGEYGIGTNPESFAQFGFRMYFVDSNRGTVIRLSNDGITPVSEYGMSGFFQDNLPVNKKIIGSWDANTSNYNVTLNTLTPYWQQTLGAGKTDRLNKDPECGAFINEYPTYSTTISFKDSLNGWTSRKAYIPENGISLNNVYYTFNSGKIWEMNSNTSYNNFYGRGPSHVSLGVYYESSFTDIFNESSIAVKDFRTISYNGTDSRKYIYKTTATGDRHLSLAQLQAQQLIPTEVSTTEGWYANSIVTDLQEGEVKELINKEGKYYNYIKGLPTFFVDDCNNNVDSREFSVQGIGRASNITGPDTSDFNVNVSTLPNSECYFITDDNFYQLVGESLLADPVNGGSVPVFGPMSTWDVSRVTEMSFAFQFKSTFNGDISGWDVSNVVFMDSMFYGADAFNQDIGSWVTSSATEMSNMFYDADAFNKDLNSWDVSGVTNMNSMFQRASNFNGDISGWDVGEVVTMQSMFADAANFNNNIGSWDVRNVTRMGFMFSGADSFNQNINAWNVSSVENMQSMFAYADIFNQELNSWDVSKVENMSGMFKYAYRFNRDLNSWNVGKVETMRGMFNGTYDFNGDISSWDVSKVEDMGWMFNGASDFDGGIGSWNVINVTDMGYMFNGASDFNQTIGSWEVDNVSIMDRMFKDALNFDEDISGWCVTNITSEPAAFSLNAPLSNADKPVWGTCP